MALTTAGDAGTRFLVDRNVGRLCTWLRAMGYNATFAGPEDDGAIVGAALREGRALVPKDRKLTERRVVTTGALPVVVITEDRIKPQLAELVAALPPAPMREFTRCIRCNVELHQEPKEAVAAEVPPYVAAHHDVFSRCPSCRRVYWQGTHWARMRRVIEEAHG